MDVDSDTSLSSSVGIPGTGKMTVRVDTSLSSECSSAGTPSTCTGKRTNIIPDVSIDELFACCLDISLTGSSKSDNTFKDCTNPFGKYCNNILN